MQAMSTFPTPTEGLEDVEVENPEPESGTPIFDDITDTEDHS